MSQKVGGVHLAALTAGGALCFFLAIMGCTDIGDVLYADPQGVTVWVATSSLVISNKTGQMISSFAVERRTSRLLDWIPTSSPTPISFTNGEVLP